MKPRDFHFRIQLELTERAQVQCGVVPLCIMVIHRPYGIYAYYALRLYIYSLEYTPMLYLYTYHVAYAPNMLYLYVYIYIYVFIHARI